MTNSVERALGRIEGRLGGLQSSVDGMDEKLDRVDDRLRSVERRTVIQSGTISAAVSTATAAIAVKLGLPPTA